MKIKTILFDLDGTLIDTNELIYESFKHTFAHYGYEFTDQELLEFNGPPLITTFTNLNKDLAEEMITVYRTHNLFHHNDYVVEFDNVTDTLKQLKAHGIKLGIVSTKMRQGVELGLACTGIREYFDSIVTMDDVQHAKPHPEPVLKGMMELQGEAQSTLMVGDNYHDIESGTYAGVQTAAVAWSKKGAEYLQTFHPTYMLKNMKDLLEIVGV